MKKQTMKQQILDALKQQGGMKPAQLIKLLQKPKSSVYTNIAHLYKTKLIEKLKDGSLICFRTPTMGDVVDELLTTNTVSKVTNKPVINNARYIRSLEQQVRDAKSWLERKDDDYVKLDKEYTQAKVMYLDSQAVVKYLEEKIAKLVKG